MLERKRSLRPTVTDVTKRFVPLEAGAPWTRQSSMGALRAWASATAHFFLLFKDARLRGVRPRLKSRASTERQIPRGGRIELAALTRQNEDRDVRQVRAVSMLRGYEAAWLRRLALIPQRSSSSPPVRPAETPSGSVLDHHRVNVSLRAQLGIDVVAVGA